MKRVAITGTGGFLGSAVRNALQSELGPDGVLPVRRSSQGGRVYESIPDCDVLFHLGGGSSVATALEAPIADLDAHVHSTIELLEAARRGSVGAVILASSAAVYGRFDGAVTETTPTKPISAYGASKLTAEIYLSTYCRQFGLDGRVARIANPYGPGQRKYVVYDLARRAVTQAPPLRLRGTGEEVRDFVYVDDAVSALIAIAMTGAPGETYNIGSDRPVRMLTVAQLVAEAAGLPPDRLEVEGQNEAGKVQTFYCDTQRIRSLGWKPGTSLEAGIETTVQWVRKEAACAE